MISTNISLFISVFFFSSRRRHTRCLSDWSSDVCSSDLALAVKLTMHVDRARSLAAAGGDASEIEYHNGQVDLLVPLIKAYGSDQSFQVCEIGRASCRERV